MRKSSLQKRTGSLPWDDLRCVLAVARTGSLSGAARELEIRHSTVFRRVNAIERRLGVKLFERSREGYVPTARGELAAAAAGIIESEVLKIEKQFMGSHSQLAGVVRLSTSELFAAFLLPHVLKSFLDTHPGVEVEVSVSSRVVDLTRRDADLALRATTAPPDNLVGRQVGELRYAVYGAEQFAGPHSGTLDNLPWLGFDDTLAYLAIARWQRAQSAQRRSRVRFNSLVPLLHAAAEGLGIAILPLFAADQHRSLIRLSPVLDQPRMRLWVLGHPDQRVNARVAALSRHLAKHVPGVLAEQQRLVLERA